MSHLPAVVLSSAIDALLVHAVLARMVVALVEARLVDEVLLALGAKLAAPVPPVFVAVELVVVHAETGKGRTRERRRRTRRRLASAIVVGRVVV